MTHHHRKLAAALLLTTAVVAGPLAVDAFYPGVAVAAQSAQSTAVDTLARPGSFAPIVKAVKPAVVTVEVRGPAPADDAQGSNPLEDFMRRMPQGQNGPQAMPMPMPGRPGGGEGEMHGLGSGFIIDPSGIIVTNNHVVENASDIRVTLGDDTELPAKLIGRDPKTDLAVIKVEADHPLPTVAWGDSDKAEIGDWVLAIGDPFGLGESVSAGILSARGRNLHAGPYDDFLQVDAAINRGNSGGPLLDQSGNVIGVNSAILSPNGGNVGLGFAIPSNLAKDVIAQLEKTGTVERGFLGVQIQPVNADIADALSLPSASGALVAEVTPASPAAEAGLRAGDVITEFGGTAIADPHELSRTVAAAKIGEPEKVAILRDGKAETVSVTVGRMPNDDHVAVDQMGSSDNANVRFGMALTDITPEMRDQLRLGTDENGAVIANVAPDGAAAAAGLTPGDVIVAVGKEKVANANQAIDALREAADQGSGKILVLVAHDGHHIYMTLDSKTS